MADKKINLKNLFAGMQAQMLAQLNVNRSAINHAPSKGDALENAWIDFLRIYLPTRYSIDKAIVVDNQGSTSDQIDIVIYDNYYTPFIFSQNGFKYVPAEGVYAVFEVKPDLSKANIKYAANKIESVRKLNRSAATFYIGGTKMADPRPHTKILGGILCSSIASDNPKRSIIESNFKSHTNLKTIDLGCVMDYGSFYINYSPESEITVVGQKAYLDFYKNRKYKNTHFSHKQHSLVTFFIQLSRYLQQSIGTVPAIDLGSYLEAIGEKLDLKI